MSSHPHSSQLLRAPESPKVLVPPYSTGDCSYQPQNLSSLAQPSTEPPPLNLLPLDSDSITHLHMPPVSSSPQGQRLAEEMDRHRQTDSQRETHRWRGEGEGQRQTEKAESEGQPDGKKWEPVRFLTKEGRTGSHRDEPTDRDGPGEERWAVKLRIMPRLEGMVRSPTSQTPTVHSALTLEKASTSLPSSLWQLSPELSAPGPGLGSPVSVLSGWMPPTDPALRAPSGSELSSGLSSPTRRAAGVSAMLGDVPPGSPPWPGVQLCQAGSAHSSVFPGSPGRGRGVSCSMVLPRVPRTRAGGHHPARWRGW